MSQYVSVHASNILWKACASAAAAPKQASIWAGAPAGSQTCQLGSPPRCWMSPVRCPVW